MIFVDFRIFILLHATLFSLLLKTRVDQNNKTQLIERRYILNVLVSFKFPIKKKKYSYIFTEAIGTEE